MIIKHDKEELFYIYDVDDEGYIRNRRAKSLEDICKYIVSELINKYEPLTPYLDYFHVWMDKIGYLFPLEAYRGLAVFYTSGSNEGFYFDVEAIYPDKKNELLFSGRTHSDNREDAIKIHNALSRILEV